MSEPQRINDAATQLERIAARAIKLYSRPTVAMEIVRLTEEEQVDADALKHCIEKDPALACKILRVVNSSLFGLTSRVGDLNQALGLLGIKPLKLLVLGFSLPDSLFAEVAAAELRWYWTNTLTRAVAARLIAEQWWQQPGDEAFIAGLLEDIGTLVMLRELSRPYAKFLSGVIDEHCHLRTLERTTIGFDHVQLSIALLTRWQLPPKLIDAIAAPRQAAQLARLTPPEGDLPQVLHLADLLTQLVGQRRLHVLPDLLAAGQAYRQLTKPQLTKLVIELQAQVDQLADALSLELETGRDYAHILCDAHEQMGALSEEVVAWMHGTRSDEDAYARLSDQSHELSDAMQAFLAPEPKAGADREAGRGDSARFGPTDAEASGTPGRTALMRKLFAAGSRCRQRRQELSLLLVSAHVQDASTSASAEEINRRVRGAIGRACASFDSENVSLVSLGDRRAAAILSDCERSAALAAAHLAMRQLNPSGSPSVEASSGTVATVEITLSAGVATASVVPKNFDPVRLIESAQRCLNAARACGISAVKSIEV
ncbi:MAG: HDOD domain-containing protein [Pirellulales bacterium]